MADLNLISILPSQPVSGVTQTHVPTGAGSQATSIINTLPPGTILTGFIVNRDPSGNPILRTDSGDITFSSNFFLKIGSEVVIRVENTGGNSLAHILSVDGQSPEIAETQSAFAHEPQVIVSPNLTPAASTVQLSAATPVNAPAIQQEPVLTVTGTLISQPQGSASAAALPTGSQLTLNIVNLNVVANATPEEFFLAAPPQTPTTSALSSQANTTHYAAYAKAAGTPQPLTPSVVTSPLSITPSTTPAAITAAAIPEPLATAPQVTLSTPTSAAPAATTPASVAPQTPTPAAPLPYAVSPAIAAITATVTAPVPSTAPNSPAVPVAPTVAYQPGQIVAATVIGNEPTGEALVQTPLGVVRLQPGTVIPTGATLTFQIVQTAAQAAAPGIGVAIPVTQNPAPLTELAQQWTTLQQISDLLAGRNVPSGFVLPQINLAALTQAIAGTQDNDPTPKNISSGLLLFISALRGSDFRGWVGKDNVKWLEDSGHDGLIKKAESEFMLLSRQFTAEVKPQHWQPLFFPVAVDGALQQVRVFVKRDRSKQRNAPQGKETEDTRFVIEVDLTQLGELQLDGFTRKNDNELQFDMVIRSLHPLSQEIQQDILRLYNDTGAITGYTGSLMFQPVKEFPVNPMEDIVATMGAVVA